MTPSLNGLDGIYYKYDNYKNKTKSEEFFGDLLMIKKVTTSGYFGLIKALINAQPTFPSPQVIDTQLLARDKQSPAIADESDAAHP